RTMAKNRRRCATHRLPEHTSASAGAAGSRWANEPARPWCTRRSETASAGIGAEAVLPLERTGQQDGGVVLLQSIPEAVLPLERTGPPAAQEEPAEREVDDDR